MSNITQKQLFDEYCKWIAGLNTPTQAVNIRKTLMNDLRLDGKDRFALSALIDEQLLNIQAINNKVFLLKRLDEAITKAKDEYLSFETDKDPEQKNKLLGIYKGLNQALILFIEEIKTN